MKKYLWMLIAVAIMLSPIAITGCGSDDTTSDSVVKKTIGPGNLDNFEGK